MTKRQRIEQSLGERYDFRYNALTGSVEYRIKGEDNYQPHTDYIMNSIIRKIDQVSAENVSEGMYKSIVTSDFSKYHHPLTDYFHTYIESLGETDSTQYIQKMAETVTVQNPESWLLTLKRWLVASVANALTEKGCQNHTCIVLTGGMGLFKTTWLMNLCPPSLAPEMIFTGKIDLNLANKDTFMLLANKLIINLDDQLRNLMKKDSETMKTLVTHPEVSIRRPFAKFSETLPRIANYLASINGNQFLAEQENRRFFPHEVSAIDIKAAQDMNVDLIWWEAYNLWKTGYVYWWTKAEIEAAYPNMDDFAFASDELEIITSYFAIPDDRFKANAEMNATEVAAYLKNKAGLVLSTKKIGEALKSLAAIQFKKREGATVVTKYALIDLSKVDEPKRFLDMKDGKVIAKTVS